MTIHVKQATSGLWHWSVVGEDERTPLGRGVAGSEAEAIEDAQFGIDANLLRLPQPYHWSAWVSVVYPVRDVWRWVIIILNRPIYGGACDTFEFAELQTFFAMRHAFRPWGDYDRPYTDEFADGELLDPLTVNAQKENQL